MREISQFIRKHGLSKFLTSSPLDQQCHLLGTHVSIINSQSIMHTLCLVTCSRSEGLAFSFRFSSMVCIKFLRSSEAFCSASFLCFISSTAASLSACVGTWEADCKREIKLEENDTFSQFHGKLYNPDLWSSCYFTCHDYKTDLDSLKFSSF